MSETHKGSLLTNTNTHTHTHTHTHSCPPTGTQVLNCYLLLYVVCNCSQRAKCLYVQIYSLNTTQTNVGNYDSTFTIWGGIYMFVSPGRRSHFLNFCAHLVPSFIYTPSPAAVELTDPFFVEFGILNLQKTAHSSNPHYCWNVTSELLLHVEDEGVC